MKWIKRSTNLSLYVLENEFSSSCIGKLQPKNTHKSQHESILAALNQYTTKILRSLIILTDDAIKLMWPLVWHNKYKPYNSMTRLQWFLTFLFTSQRERKAMKDKRIYYAAMDSWILVKSINRSVVVRRYSALWKKPTHPPTVSGSNSRQAGKSAPADKIQVYFKISKILYRLNYSDFNITLMLL